MERNIDASNHENANDKTKEMEILLHKQVKEVETLNMKINKLENSSAKIVTLHLSQNKVLNPMYYVWLLE